MKRIFYIFLVLTFFSIDSWASATKEDEKKVDVKEIIFDHIGDSYEWHITSINGKHIAVPLPVILISEQSGLHVFMSSVFNHEEVYKNFQMGKKGKYAYFMKGVK